jgi:hypothetical protein
MSARIARALPVWTAVGLPVFISLLLWDSSVRRGPAGSTPRWHSGLKHWDIPELARYLDTTGLSFRVIATAQGNSPTDNAYLTTTAMTRQELDYLLKLPEGLSRWKGIVFCERNLDDLNWASRLNLWGDYCLCAGPFVFFGDSELLEEIRQAVQVSR